MSVVQLSDQLVEIPCTEWSTLRDMYLRDWPTHMAGYYTIDNYVQWNKIESNIKHLHIYALNGDWQLDGTFVVVDRYQVFLNSLNTDANERIFRMLVMIDWKHGLLFSAFLDRHRPAVLQAMRKEEATTNFGHKCSIYFMSRAEAATLNVVCPEGISLRPLEQEHALIADEVWSYSHPGSLFLMKRLIDWNLNIGAFTDDGKLVAWCLRSQSGQLATLQVDSNYKQRGLGSLLTKALTKKLSEMDMDTYAAVASDKGPSMRLFESLGFKVVGCCHFLKTNPLSESEWND